MDLLERRNSLAEDLNRAAEFEASLVTGPGFDPEASQYVDAVRSRTELEQSVERIDQILASQDRAAPVRSQPGNGWTGPQP